LTVAQIGSVTTSKLVNILTAGEALSQAVAAISAQESAPLPSLTERQIMAQNVALELAEKGPGVRYPAVYVYCEKMSNALREKFRTFSGRARMVMEVRVSQDRLEGLERQLELYVDAVTQVLHDNRGDWGQGMFFPGAYEVSFGAVKHGGKNYIQVAKIMLDVEISTN
jgi:hypothetical protein